MDDIWLEDVLVAIDDQGRKSTRGTPAGVPNQAHASAVVRIAHPVCREVKIGKSPLVGRHWLVRMCVEFETYKPRVEFLFADCHAYIEKMFPKDPADPRTIEIFPTNVMDQEPNNIKIKLEPTIKFSFAKLTAGASLGDVSKEISIGRISSETIGYMGAQQRNPHWKLNPGKYQIEGLRDFFMLVEQPPGCQKVAIRMRVEAKIRTHNGIFHVGPRDEPNDGPNNKSKIWANRPRIGIE